jgi:hypothetical protein
MQYLFRHLLLPLLLFKRDAPRVSDSDHQVTWLWFPVSQGYQTAKTEVKRKLGQRKTRETGRDNTDG